MITVLKDRNVRRELTLIAFYYVFALFMAGVGCVFVGMFIYTANTEGFAAATKDVAIPLLGAILGAYLCYSTMRKNRHRVFFAELRWKMARKPDVMIARAPHKTLLGKDEDLKRLSEKISKVCRNYSSVGPHFRFVMVNYLYLVSAYRPGAPAEISEMRYLERLTDAALQQAETEDKPTVLKVPKESVQGGRAL